MLPTIDLNFLLKTSSSLINKLNVEDTEFFSKNPWQQHIDTAKKYCPIYCLALTHLPSEPNRVKFRMYDALSFKEYTKTNPDTDPKTGQKYLKAYYLALQVLKLDEAGNECEIQQKDYIFKRFDSQIQEKLELINYTNL